MPKVFTYKNNLYNIYIGLNTRENIQLINNADLNWWWLHLDSVPSGHVIIANTADTTHNRHNRHN
jgi:hypothetical protein